MFGLYFGTQGNNDLGTYDDPEMAYNEVVNSLELIASHFDKGTTSIGYLNEVNQGVGTVGYLQEMENTTSLIFKK